MSTRTANEARQLPTSLSWEHWRFSLLTLAVGFGAVAALFWHSYASMVDIWWRSETFAHGFLVVPISAFLIWRLRDRLAPMTPVTDPRAIVILLGTAVVWALARLTDVLVIEQFAATVMVPVVVWLVLGWRIAWVMLFPLGFLLFAVPMGEGLVPPMMDFTADFTVRALQVTGIPVYQEGTFFYIPSGHWSVVEGCSGVRYLIASITLGTLYAYLTYRATWRRLLFVSLSIVTPIIANGLRAYMIVMIAHLSDMRLALGVDHLIYGWVFFGIVMLLLFWVGGLWRERDDEDPQVTLAGPVVASRETSVRRAVVLAAALLTVAMGPALVAYLSRTASAERPIMLAAPTASKGWKRASEITSWRPRFVRPTVEQTAFYGHEHKRVGLYLAYYGGDDPGAELVNTQNVMVVQKHPVWNELYNDPRTITLNGVPVQIYESRLRAPSRGENLLAWHWYWIAGHHTSSTLRGKLAELVERLQGRIPAESGIVVFTPIDESLDAARATLQSFLDGMLGDIEQTLRTAKRN